jgi:hypothetical protein
MASAAAENVSGFTINPDPSARLIRYRLAGLWDRDTHRKYYDAAVAEMRKFHAAGVSFNMLGDLRDFKTQAQDLNDQRQDLVRTAMTLGLNKCAIVLSSQIVRMQLSRLTSTDAIAFFTSEEEAKEWLGI